ncbi:MAG TPA: PAS domain S-box protein [Bryobacteraceae bacterium]|nr:PAS domain S-box protein [Bryobacteraceae bacterium]
MSRSVPGIVSGIPHDPWWVRYSFALACCVLGVVLELVLNRLTGQPVYPFLLAFAAIIASAALAGAGPGLAATALLVTWAAFDLWEYDRTPNGIFWRCLILGVEGVVLSIGSARMWKAKREADRSEAWHRRLVETAAEGIWVRDDAGVITYANARMAEMLGVPLGELVGRKEEEFFLPADLSVERIRAENLHHGRKEQFDRRLRRNDGTEIWVLTCSNLLHADESEKPGSLAMMTDITERKRAEYALRRSEERFRNLFETVLEGVYQSTPDGRILHANPMLIRMLGLSNETELNDINIAKDLYVDPHIRQRLIERLEHEGGFQNVEYELRRRDGRIISVLENARAVRDESGSIVYYEGTLTDITPRKKMEEQLRQAQKAEALGRLAGGIAHDFNNVLTVVTGYAQLVLTELDPSHRARSSAEQLLDAAGNAMKLTNQLLSFSRRQVPVQGSTDLNSAIERSQPALRLLLGDRASGRNTGLILSLCPEATPVYAGQTQVELTLLSLAAWVRNVAPIAIVHVKTELVHLDDEVCDRCGGLQPGLYVALSVRGLQDESPDHTSVIDLFGALTAMPAAESAALGLSSAHAMVTQRGGFLSAGVTAGASEQRCGFHVFLPCAMARIDGDPEKEKTGDAGGETILLVEDEPLVRELSRDMLERQGYRVVLASDAREAEKISADSGGFDLLITDAVMPNMSGVELARRIRLSHPGMKVLFIAGYSDESGESVEGAEGSAFLQKPFSADSLGRKIRQILRR